VLITLRATRDDERLRHCLLPKEAKKPTPNTTHTIIVFASSTNPSMSTVNLKWEPNLLDPEVEKKGAKDVLDALTEEEKAAMPDPKMPLRHFRAEKVSRRGEAHSKALKDRIAIIYLLTLFFTSGINRETRNFQSKRSRQH
jgi:hypothetical protein